MMEKKGMEIFCNMSAKSMAVTSSSSSWICGMNDSGLRLMNHWLIPSREADGSDQISESFDQDTHLTNWTQSQSVDLLLNSFFGVLVECRFHELKMSLRLQDPCLEFSVEKQLPVLDNIELVPDTEFLEPDCESKRDNVIKIQNPDRFLLLDECMHWWHARTREDDKILFKKFGDHIWQKIREGFHGTDRSWCESKEWINVLVEFFASLTKKLSFGSRVDTVFRWHFGWWW